MIAISLTPEWISAMSDVVVASTVLLAGVAWAYKRYQQWKKPSLGKDEIVALIKDVVRKESEKHSSVKQKLPSWGKVRERVRTKEQRLHNKAQRARNRKQRLPFRRKNPNETTSEDPTPS